MNLLIIMIVVFLAHFWRNWLIADSPFWRLMLSAAGYTAEEISNILLTRSIGFGILGLGTSIGLLVLNYYLGKRYKLTRRSTIAYVFLLIISITLGLLLGYGIKQFQHPQYSILDTSTAIEIPYDLSSTVPWYVLGMLAGNYKSETEQKRKGLEE
ncbi:MAG: hypothetical protein OEY88_10000 [Candidatus Bathyarchaeota archaeon]|nr:hypothetical protein [Candidatus Bathyarchaeota archaeon]